MKLQTHHSREAFVAANNFVMRKSDYWETVS